MSTSGAILFAAPRRTVMYHRRARRVAQERARLFGDGRRRSTRLTPTGGGRSLRLAPREMARGERDGEPDAEHVYEQPRDERDGRGRAALEGRGRERDDDVVHQGVDGRAVEY